MKKELCVRLKDGKYVCNETYINNNKKNLSQGPYEVLKDGFVNSIEELINYCLTFCYDMEIPEGYGVETIYNVVFTTGNFDPDGREYSNCHSSVIFSSVNKDVCEKKFKYYCKSVGRKAILENKRHYCWHTEDFAYNQVIHSYELCESYIVRKLEVI